MRRETRRERRRRVIRNRIIALIVIVVLVIAIVAVIALLTKDKKPNKEIETETSSSEVVTETTSEAPTGNPDDVTPPKVSGPTNIYVSLGDTVSYKSNIYVEDDYDPNPTIKVDSSDVDLSKEGEYVVHYTVTDASGNVTKKDIPVIVGPHEDTTVDEQVIFDLADKILSEIITEDMTDLQKVFAVFFYVRDSFEYTPSEFKMEYKQEAYKLLSTGRDNCYGNVCASKLLLERLGYQSFMIEGKLGYAVDGVYEPHYWNMVSIDNGETWYHYDSTIWVWKNREYPLCMMTDSFAQKISDGHDGLYIYDKENYPATPENMLWDPVEMGYYSEFE